MGADGHWKRAWAGSAPGAAVAAIGGLAPPAPGPRPARPASRERLFVIRGTSLISRLSPRRCSRALGFGGRWSDLRSPGGIGGISREVRFLGALRRRLGIHAEPRCAPCSSTYDGRLIQLGCPPLSTHNVVNLVALARRIVRIVESDPRAMRQDDVCTAAPDSSLSKHVFSRYRCIWVQVHNIHDRLRPL